MEDERILMSQRQLQRWHAMGLGMFWGRIIILEQFVLALSHVASGANKATRRTPNVL
jgi:hypothetical protein